MIVYTVSFEIDDFIVDKIFSTREKAENYIKDKGYSRHDNDNEFYCKMNDDGFAMCGFLRAVNVE